MNRPRVTITTRRVTRLSLSRDEYFFSRSRISSLAACPHRARVVRLGSFDPRATPPSGARDRNCVEFARSRRARDGSTSTTTRNDDGSFLCSSFGDSRARAFAGARLGRACCDDRRHTSRIVAATTDRPFRVKPRARRARAEGDAEGA